MMSKLLSSSSDGNTSSSSSSRMNVSYVTVYFAEHLLAEILCYLPVKNLLRFRCVSKLWCSLIDSPCFVKTHLKRSTECKTNTGVIVGGCVSYSVDFDSLDNATTAVEIDEPLKTLLCDTGNVGSCNGLQCLFNMEADMFLWNPTTRKCRKLPTAPTDFGRPFEFDWSSLCGFGYDIVNDDYKVLRIRLPNDKNSGSKVAVYSLKTNSWRRLQNISSHFQFTGAWGMYIDGALHWITLKTLGLESCPSILAFDLGVENYREVPMPLNKNVNDMGLTIFAESLCMLEYHLDIRIDVWVMSDYGVGDSWCKLFSVDQPKVNKFCTSLRPLAYSKSQRDVLLQADNKKVMWYNLERKELKTVKIANIPDVFDMEVFTESLVPLDSSFSCDRKKVQKQAQDKKKQQQQQKRNESDGPQLLLLTLSTYLPEHLVAEILYRLRAKILLRLRCVSKAWCSLIDSPHFVKTHLKRSVQCITNAAVIWMDSRSYSVDFDSLKNVTAIRTAEPLKRRLFGAALVGSCNGLHCLFNPDGDVFLWNPATRKCNKLPTAPIDFNRTNGFGLASVCGFGYDTVNDDYKVLSIFRPDGHELADSEVVVYGLKTNSWRWLQNISSQFQFIGVFGMFVSGALHWMTTKTLDSGSCLSILAYDLGIENYREVSMPKVQIRNVADLSIVIFAESLCILEDHFDILRTDVWVMNEYGVGNSWCKLFSFARQKVHRSVESLRPVRPVTYSKSRKDVLLEVDKEKLMWYNLETKKVKTAKVGNIEGVFDMEVYTESLVPPDYKFSCPLHKQPEEKKKQQQQKNERHKFLSKGFKLVL